MDRPVAPRCSPGCRRYVGVGYWIVEHEAMAYRAGDYTLVDVSMGVIVTVVAIEAARRVLGWDMSMCAVLPIVYALFGNYLPYHHRPSRLYHAPDDRIRLSDFRRHLRHHGACCRRALSFPSSSSALFWRVQALRNFLSIISLAALGRIAGGPAQAAVISSLFMGTISGSPIAETVTTGPITIPLMKKRRLSAAHRGGSGRSGFHRGDDNAARHGCGRLHHGRNDRHSIP